MSSSWYIIPDLSSREINLHAKIIKLLAGGGRILFGCDTLDYDEISLRSREESEDDFFEFYLIDGIFIDPDEKRARIKKSAIDILRSDAAFATFESEGFFDEDDFSLEKILDCCRGIGESTLRNIKKMVFWELYPKNTHDENRIRFICSEDFSFRKYIGDVSWIPCVENCGFKCKWYDYSDIDERGLICLLNSSNLYNLIITDDLGDVSNFTYYLNFIEHNKFILAINDAKDNLNDYIEIITKNILNEKFKIKKYTDVGDI